MIFLSNFMNDNMMNLTSYIQQFPILFPELQKELPWNIPSQIEPILINRIKTLSTDYKINGEVAIHKTARIEEHVVLKGPIIISEGCFVGAHAYLRGGVFLGDKAVIGPGCEVKSSFIMQNSALAHFNFVGDSLLGSMVNLEAGSILANHYNERLDKTIYVLINGKKTPIAVTKFGAMIGDQTKIGANAVLSPGTILEPKSIVKRLELVEQC
jgi:NDP-sugar pyrophosphorylase family protein